MTYPKTPSAVFDDAEKRSEGDPVLRDSLQRYKGIDPLIRQSYYWFTVFEAWNLLVILTSLAGFAYIPWLVQQGWMPGALWVAALGTVGVTGYGVFAWVK